MKLEQEIEAVLFYKNEPVALSWLAKTLGRSREEIEDAARELSKNLESRGIALIQTNEELALGTAPALAGMIEKITKEELSGELGKAALETLAVILYMGEVPRSMVDYVRGVNSQFTLRHLAVSGLIERRVKKDDARSYVYSPSTALYSLLGITRQEELPDFVQVETRLRELQDQNEKVTPPNPAD